MQRPITSWIDWMGEDPVVADHPDDGEIGTYGLSESIDLDELIEDFRIRFHLRGRNTNT